MPLRIRYLAALVAALAIATWASVASATEVLIKSDLTGRYAVMQNGSLHASARAGDAARFEMIRLGGGRYAFRARDGSYLRAGVGPNTLLATGSPHARGWETFETVRYGGSTALRSVQNGLYVEADQRTGRLSATAARMSQRTSFSLVERPSGHHAGQPPRVEWTGRWTQMWVASPNGNLHRPPAGSRTDFTISTGREIEMTAGCNTVYARMTVDGNRVSLANVTLTRMRCSNAQQGYEEGMARAFERARSYEYREGQVAFLDAGGRTVFQIGR